jgi:hypothetical protein
MRTKYQNMKEQNTEAVITVAEMISRCSRRRNGNIQTFNTPQLFAQCDKISPFHMAPPNKPQNLLGSKHRQALKVLSIDTIFFKHLSVATKIYLFKPQSNILKENNNLIR